MVSNSFAKSIGLGGSKPIKARSISEGGGYACPIGDHSSTGALKAAANPHRSTYQNKSVNAGSGAKGHGGSIDKAPTTKDPLQKGKR